MNDILYFHSSVCDLMQNEVNFYSRILKSKLYPLICNVDEEVEKEVKSAEEKISCNFNPDYHDVGECCEKLNDIEISHGIYLYEINGYIALLGIAGLFHLWERQILNFLKREISHCNDFRDSDVRGFGNIKNTFMKYSTNIEVFPFYKHLNELRLVSNSVKHGGGNSLRELKKLNADILNKNDTPDPFSWGEYTLSGVGLFPTEQHIDRYTNAIMLFWDSNLWKEYGEYRHRATKITQ